MSTNRKLMFSVLIASLMSFWPVFFPSLNFLSVLGAVVAGLIFGVRVEATSPMVRPLTNLIVCSMGLYLGFTLWQSGQTDPSRQTPRAAKVLYIFWVALLLPWLLIALGTGIAFDGGPTSEAYTFVWSVWTYPVILGIAAVIRRWAPWAVLLPVINFAGCVASELLHKPR